MKTRLKVTSLIFPTLLTGLAVFFSVATPAVAKDDQDLFAGSVTALIPADLGPPDPTGCVYNFTVSNSGSATELGTFTGTANFIPNVCDGSYTGSFHWVAADGSSISGPFLGQQIPTAMPGVFLTLKPRSSPAAPVVSSTLRACSICTGK